MFYICKNFYVFQFYVEKNDALENGGGLAGAFSAPSSLSLRPCSVRIPNFEGKHWTWWKFKNCRTPPKKQPLEVLKKKKFLKMFQNSQEKNLCQSLFINKYAGMR